MAIKESDVQQLSTWGERDKVHICTWQNLLNGDEGASFELPISNDRSIQVSGNFGVGGAVSLQGSNDGISYFSLADAQGIALNFTTGKIEIILELTRYIKPVVTGGDVDTDLKVVVLARRGI